MSSRAKKNKKPSSSERQKALAADESRDSVQVDGTAADFSFGWPARGMLVVLLGVLGWSYWPVMSSLVDAWMSKPDYSHGWLVIPTALYLLGWERRGSFPKNSPEMFWLGWGVLAGGLILRWLGGLWYVPSFESWSLLLVLGGIIWITFGWSVFRWSAPAIGFLFFMIPLPFSAEGALSFPLQRVATKLSCWTLQLLGLPALAEGNVIAFNDIRLEVAQACSGLLIFVSILALGYLFLLLARDPWWIKGILALAILPIALVANATRIVITGLLYAWVSGEAARGFSHDFAGLIMIPWAGVLFWAVLWYSRHIMVRHEVVNVRELVGNDSQGSSSVTEKVLASPRS